MTLAVNAVTLPPGNSTCYNLVSGVEFAWALPVAWQQGFLQLGIDLLPQMLAVVLHVMRERFVHFVSHPCMDHAMGYHLALCLPNLLE